MVTGGGSIIIRLTSCIFLEIGEYSGHVKLTVIEYIYHVRNNFTGLKKEAVNVVG